jgi:hypothetical protein
MDILGALISWMMSFRQACSFSLEWVARGRRGAGYQVTTSPREWPRRGRVGVDCRGREGLAVVSRQQGLGVQRGLRGESMEFPQVIERTDRIHPADTGRRRLERERRSVVTPQRSADRWDA